MSFEKNVPKWNASGAEPPESLKNSGFTPGYKPPADYFNWFWHGIGEAVEELQEKSVERSDVSIRTFTSLSQIGLSGAVTMRQVLEALPDKAILVFGNTNDAGSVDYVSDVPAQYGLIEAVRYSATRSVARFTRSDDSGVQCYVGKYHSSEGWSGWFKDYNSASKPTLDELGAASSAEQNTKHYTAFNQIGLTVGSETIETITTYLPNNAKIALNITKGTNADIYPADYGSLEVHRLTQYRVSWVFTAKPSDPSKPAERYFGYSYIGDNNAGVNWSGWQKLYTDKNKPTAADIGAVSNKGDTVNGNLNVTGKLQRNGEDVLTKTNVTTYNSLEQIGLTTGTETIADIARELPVNSMLYYTVASSSNLAEFPNGNFGLLVVDKTVVSRMVFTFTNAAGSQYVGYYSITSTSDDVWTGWIKTVNANDILSGTTDLVAGSTTLASGKLYLVYE